MRPLSILSNWKFSETPVFLTTTPERRGCLVSVLYLSISITSMVQKSTSNRVEQKTNSAKFRSLSTLSFQHKFSNDWGTDWMLTPKKALLQDSNDARSSAPVKFWQFTFHYGTFVKSSALCRFNPDTCKHKFSILHSQEILHFHQVFLAEAPAFSQALMTLPKLKALGETSKAEVIKCRKRILRWIDFSKSPPPPPPDPALNDVITRLKWAFSLA